MSHGGESSTAEGPSVTELVYGAEAAAKVAAARVLVVGAGGIGCELLKNLVLTGFRNIDVVDLDNIDLSNLNRQFLFSREHIGRSKCQVASAVVQSRWGGCAPAAGGLCVRAHHENIKSPALGPTFVGSCSLVVNALDNLDARRHVNRVCLAAGVPLLESATEGYMGHVNPIRGGATECFECQPRQAPKVYAVCTIRSNPTEPIHCITWAKMLFARLWGVQDDSNAVTDLDKAPGAEDAQAAAARARGKAYDAFHRVFCADIRELASMTKLWEGRRAPPAPITYDEALQLTEPPAGAGAGDEGPQGAVRHPDQVVWSVAQCARAFVASHDAIEAEAARSTTALAWDKDDDAALDFVVAAANVRAHVFGIPLLSRFDIKAKAGNIIPAIATSNAIISGVLATEAVKVVTGRFDACRNVHLTMTARKPLLVSQQERPNPSCYVCGAAFVTATCDTQAATLGDFVARVAKGALGVAEPTVIVGDRIVYECGDDLEDDEVERYKGLAAQPLAKLGVVDGTTVMVESSSVKLSVNVTVRQSDAAAAAAAQASEDPNPFVVGGNLPAPKAADADAGAGAAAAAAPKVAEAARQDDDEVEVVDKACVTTCHKRRRSSENAEEDGCVVLD
eukprot:m51a1_g13902 putative sumo-activating enzyme subunit 2 (622) ;mRNA; r:751841-753833